MDLWKSKRRGYFSIEDEVRVTLSVGNRELLKVFEQGGSMTGFHDTNNPN